MSSHTQFFRDCRDYLLNPGRKKEWPEQVREFVASLTSIHAHPDDGGSDAKNILGDLAKLVNLASESQHLFRMRLRHAPGACFAGATFSHDALGGLHTEVPAIQTGAAGTTWRDAFCACMGEAAEILSFLEHHEEPLIVRQHRPHNLTPFELNWALAASGIDEIETVRDWAIAQAVSDPGNKVSFPVDLIVRRTEQRREGTQSAESAGLGAGRTLDHAIYSGLLEIIERDAVAMWWYGGRKANRIVHWDSQLDLSSFAREIRGQSSRPCWFLDLTTDLEIPVVAAVSSNDRGGEVSTGFKANPDYRKAMRGAFVELCQMEFAREISVAKGAENRENLTLTDKSWIEKNGKLEVNSFPELYPDQTTRYSKNLRYAADPFSLSLILENSVFKPYFVDITRPRMNIPCAKVLVPGLQSMNPHLMTDRLKQTAEKNRIKQADVFKKMSPL